MAFFEQQFDPRLSFGARGGPVWNTARVMTQSGRRRANQNWQYPLHRYQVAHAVKSNADFELVRAFFYTVAGAFDGFRFKDWADFELTKANSRLVQDASSPAEFQIHRVYAVGTRTFLRPITKPCASPALVVYRTRSGAESVATAGVDTTTGVVDISGHATGDTYTCVGEFDVPVAFADDAMDVEIVDRGADEYLMRWPSITLEEVRV
jgi:uncharacterized protein (TIGR02217 family)